MSGANGSRRPLRAAIVGCGRMGGTIDEEVKSYTPIVLPYSHAATYAATAGVELVEAFEAAGRFRVVKRNVFVWQHKLDLAYRAYCTCSTNHRLGCISAIMTV